MLQAALQQSYLIPQALRNERLSPEAVRALQERKLRAMVRHVWEKSSFYRQKFQQAGLTPAELQTVADLAKLPPTTKAEIQAVGSEQVVAQGYSEANTFHEMIRWGIDHGIRQIYGGVSKEREKRKHGFYQQARWIGYRARSPLLNAPLRLAIPLAQKFVMR